MVQTMSSMTPQEIVHELNKHIVGQEAAKKAVAIALRNRWRRQQIIGPLSQEITPKKKSSETDFIQACQKSQTQKIDCKKLKQL